MGKGKDPLAAKRKASKELRDEGMRDLIRQENLKLLAEATAEATHMAMLRLYYKKRKEGLRKKGPKQS